jgi:hypothetical protein
VARGDADENRRLVHRHGTRPMPQNDPPRTEAATGGSLEVEKDAASERDVRLVDEGGDPAAGREVRTDPADEHDDPSEPRPFQGAQRRSVGDAVAVHSNGHR